MSTPPAGRNDPATLLAAARSGDRRARARLLSLVESGEAAGREVGRLVFPLAGGAYTLGLTGAPGAGKSTLTSGLLGRMRAEDLPVAVLAVDPSSPFTGGAILGDRVRMGDHALDAGVFIRSMATRGHLGGLALATPEAVRVLEATGAAWVVLETVGVGQVEIEVAGAADTTVVVLNPGWGDAVQANKAGLMEIADVFVINKADRDGVAQTRRDLRQALELAGTDGDGWEPPIVDAVATTGQGVDEVWVAVGRHRAHLEGGGELATRRAQRLRGELRSIVGERLLQRAVGLLGAEGVSRLEDEVASRRLDPYDAADELLGPVGA